MNIVTNHLWQCVGESVNANYSKRMKEKKKKDLTTHKNHQNATCHVFQDVQKHCKKAYYN